jgi:hypothetical protein
MIKFRRPKRVLGANPPEGAEWQLGKTAPAIRFVNEAERFFQMMPEDRYGYSEEAVKLLRKRIVELKSGEKTLFNWQDVDEFLALHGFKRKK